MSLNIRFKKNHSEGLPSEYDGYFVENGMLGFYNDTAVYTAMRSKRPKVDKDKVIYWEGLCETYRESFELQGCLRLHTPTKPGIFLRISPDTLNFFNEKSQEQLGGYFLYVPPKHRARIAEMLNGGTLVMLDRLKTFLIVESGKQITFQQLLGDGEFFEYDKATYENRRDFENDTITKVEWDRRSEALKERAKTTFNVVHLIVDLYVDTYCSSGDKQVKEDVKYRFNLKGGVIHTTYYEKTPLGEIPEAHSCVKLLFPSGTEINVSSLTELDKSMEPIFKRQNIYVGMTRYQFEDLLPPVYLYIYQVGNYYFELTEQMAKEVLSATGLELSSYPS